MSPKALYRSLASLLTLTLIGCVNPPYNFSPNEKSASIKLLFGNTLSMCRDNKLYRLTPTDDSKTVRVPTGKRVSVGTSMSYSGYNVTYSCTPFLSFLPEENTKYITDSNIINNNCHIDLVKENPTTRTGVSLEPSVSKRDCFVSN